MGSRKKIYHYRIVSQMNKKHWTTVHQTRSIANAGQSAKEP